MSNVKKTEVVKITKDMILNFNNILESKGCCFRLKYTDGTGGNPHGEIVPMSMKYIESAIINPSKDFYDDLIQFFKRKGIELSFNNTKTTFWSLYGFDNSNEEIISNSTEFNDFKVFIKKIWELSKNKARCYCCLYSPMSRVDLSEIDNIDLYLKHNNPDMLYIKHSFSDFEIYEWQFEGFDVRNSGIVEIFLRNRAIGINFNNI